MFLFVFVPEEPVLRKEASSYHVAVNVSVTLSTDTRFSAWQILSTDIILHIAVMPT